MNHVGRLAGAAVVVVAMVVRLPAPSLPKNPKEALIIELKRRVGILRDDLEATVGHPGSPKALATREGAELAAEALVRIDEDDLDLAYTIAKYEYAAFGWDIAASLSDSNKKENPTVRRCAMGCQPRVGVDRLC